MKKWWQDLQWLILYLAVWVILFERINLTIVVSGLVAAGFSLYFTEKYLLGGSYYKHYPINILWIFKYGFFLLIEIYKAGFATVKMTITGNVNPGIIDIKTDLEDDYSISILANSITLTPGTVTLDKTDNHLKVLWLDVKTKDSVEAGDIIKGNLEKHF